MVYTSFVSATMRMRSWDESAPYTNACSRGRKFFFACSSIHTEKDSFSSSAVTTKGDSQPRDGNSERLTRRGSVYKTGRSGKSLRPGRAGPRANPHLVHARARKQ